MRRHSKVFIVLVLLDITASRPAYVSAGQCDSILQFAAANIQQKTSKSVAQAEQANYLCTENYEQKGGSQSTAIEASYSVYSAKYGTDSTSFSEWRSKHCQSGQSKDFRQSDSNEYARIVHNNSVDAWVKCLELENSGILVQPAFDPTGKFVNFNVKYTGAGSVKLTGVSIQPVDSFSCRDAKKVQVGSDTEVQLSPKAWPLECTRIVEKLTDASGGRYDSAPSAMLTIRTEEKLFPIQFAELRSPDLATRNAAELMQTIQKINNDLSILEKSPIYIETYTNSTKVPGKSTDVIRCPDSSWKAVSCLTFLGKSGTSICNPMQTSNSDSCPLAGCGLVTGDEWQTNIVCIRVKKAESRAAGK